MKKRYVASKRHTIQVDFQPYLRELRRERRSSSAGVTGGGCPSRLGFRRARCDSLAGGKQDAAAEGHPASSSHRFRRADGGAAGAGWDASL